MIEYKDKGYDSKRKELRENAEIPDIAFCIDTIADEIQTAMEIFMPNSATIALDWLKIKKYLIDGFIAFEKIIDAEGNVITLSEIDPISLIPHIDENGIKTWNQIKDGVIKITIPESNIIYLSYSDNNSNLSYADSLLSSYRNLKMLEDLSIAGRISIPGMNNTDINFDSDADLEYFSDKFIQASRIPPSYFSFGSNKFIKNSEMENRFMSFILKNVYYIQNKIADASE